MGDEPPRRTLAARLENRDRDRFTGRQAEIMFVERCLDADDPPASVIHVCGPGGIGKSTLLREIARRARTRGRTVVVLDGRELGPDPEVLEAALQAVAADSGPVILLDSYEKMTALDSWLRRDLLLRLPHNSLVLTAGRGAPDAGWFQGGWESVTARLDLAAMAPDEARKLLAAYGVADSRVAAIIDWAGGSPLALALAADAATTDADWSAAYSPDRPDMLRALLHRLVETDLRDIRPSAPGIAVVARSTTPELLQAVLPGEDGDAAYRQLASLTVTEPLGGGIMMHELVRKALLADLRLRNPELERDVRRRIADYLYQRGMAGDPLVIIDMAHLVENPLIRWGFGWDGNVSLRIDAVRAGDAEKAERGSVRIPGRLWQESRRYFDEAPARVAIARDDLDQICGYMVCMSLATAPAFADSDPLMGRWLKHARDNADLGDSVLWQAAVDFTGEGKVQAMLGISGILRSGSPNPRFAYLPIDARVAGAVEFARAIGAEHVAGLDVGFDDLEIQCYRLDYGPGGLFALVRDQIYTELGLPPPGRQPRAPQRPAADPETVRDVLKNFRVPRELARSPLARGETVADRAESVRRLVRAAVADAFGDSENEKLLRSVLMAGYLEPMRSHEEAASKLLMSRAAYFRRLRTAVERLAEHMSGD